MNQQFCFDVVVESYSDADLVKKEFQQCFKLSQSVEDYDISQQEIQGLSAMDIVISFSLNIASGVSIHLLRNEIDQAYEKLKGKMNKQLDIGIDGLPDGIQIQFKADEEML